MNNMCWLHTAKAPVINPDLYYGGQGFFFTAGFHPVAASEWDK